MLEGAKLVHISITVVALALILSCDIRLALGFFKPLSAKVVGQLRLTAKAIPWLLLGLWVSGGLLVLAHSQSDLGYFLGNSKLQAKLVLVVLLSFNGMLLHQTSLKHIQPGVSLARSSQRLWMGIQGITSSSLWLACGLIGIMPKTHLAAWDILGGYFSVWAALVLGLVVLNYYLPFFNIIATALRPAAKA